MTPEERQRRVENREIRNKGKLYREKLIKERDKILEEREHYKKLYKKAPKDFKLEIIDYVSQLTQQKQQLNLLIHQSDEKLGKRCINN